MDKKYKQILPVEDIGVKSVDEEKRIIWHRITKEVPDRMGDIVRIDGLDLKKFKKKPAVLYGHDYAGKDPIPIVGKNVGFKVEGKSLYAGTQFLAADDMSEKVQDLVNDTFALMKMKLMGWSIGFIAKLTEDIKDKEGHWTGYDFKESELLEYSAVVIPAHQDAINDAITQGLVSKSFALPEPEPESKGEGPPAEELPGDAAVNRIEGADEDPEAEIPAEDLAAEEPGPEVNFDPKGSVKLGGRAAEGLVGTEMLLDVYKNGTQIGNAHGKILEILAKIPGLSPNDIKVLQARIDEANEEKKERIKCYKSLLERLEQKSKRRKTT